MSSYDVAIIGGGPAGLAAALALGRARRRVLLFDAGAPRNERAAQVHNFVTRDGTPPAEFRAVGREQLRTYPNVEVRDARVLGLTGAKDSFAVHSDSDTAGARRVILCTGMVDEMLDLPGFEEAWGHTVFQCPYCHGWEVRERHWGVLALGRELLEHGFPQLLKAWTDEVTVFSLASDAVSEAMADTLRRAGIAVERRPVVGLSVRDGQLTHVQLDGGAQIACPILYAHPPQRHVGLVQELGLELDDGGYVQANPMTRETSMPGLYAAGDLTTRGQGAIFAAAAGTQAGAMANLDLAVSA